MTKTCTLEILDQVNVKFKGLDPMVRREMVQELKYLLPNAQFMDVVRSGRWDGMVSFCTTGGKSYLNLLDVLVGIVDKNGYTIEDVIDHREPLDVQFEKVDENLFEGRTWPEGHPNAGEPIVLRDYQVSCVNDYLDDHQCIQEISTAAGKTIICAALSYLIEKHTGKRTVVIVPNKFLVEQTALDYKNVGLDTGVYYGDQKDIGNQHMICTWQSLNNLEKMGTVDGLNILDAFLDNVDCFICDEVHLAKADVLKRILTGPMAHLPIRWGLTGTIPEDEYSQLCLTISIGEVINHLTPKQLQEKGVLAECHVNIIQIQDKGSHGSYQQELKHLVTDHERMQFISDSIKNIVKSGNTLVLVDRLKAGEMLEEFMEGSIFLSGEDGNDVRREHYDKIANSDNEIIIATYGIASTGVNIPRIFNLVMIEPGKSYIKVIQSIGRGIRKAEDKDFVDIWDFTSSLKYSKRHLTKRKAFYRKVQYPFTVTKVNY